MAPPPSPSWPPPLPYRYLLRANFLKYRAIVLTVLLFIFSFCAYRYGHGGASHLPSARPHSLSPLNPPRIAKASMLYGETNFIYEQALESHLRHNQLHGYPMHVLRQQLTKGFWNKFLWLQNLIIQELQKPKEDRNEWIMWTDSSVIMLNPQVPLHIFVPPRDPLFDKINFIAAKPNNNISTSTFFVRSSPSTLTLLAKAMVAPLEHPDREWGAAVDASALEFVLEQRDYRHMALYQPWRYYSLSASNDTLATDGCDSFQMRFPGDLLGNRWQLMQDYFVVMKETPAYFEQKYEDTKYPRYIDAFWSRLKKAKQVLSDAETRTQKWEGDDKERAVDKISALRDTIELRAWDERRIDEATKDVQMIMHPH